MRTKGVPGASNNTGDDACPAAARPEPTAKTRVGVSRGGGPARDRYF